MEKLCYFFCCYIICISYSNSSAAIIILPSLPLYCDWWTWSGQVKAAIEELKGFIRKRKKNAYKRSKKEMKAFSIAKKAGKEPSTNTLLLVILAILCRHWLLSAWRCHQPASFGSALFLHLSFGCLVLYMRWSLYLARVNIILITK